jgi:hypothetical protein
VSVANPKAAHLEFYKSETFFVFHQAVNGSGFGRRYDLINYPQLLSTPEKPAFFVRFRRNYGQLPLTKGYLQFMGCKRS